MAERKPFHEAIVDVIDSLTDQVMERQAIKLVANLIKQTKIPKNHDAIVTAWANFLLRTSRWDSFGVERNLQEQKREAEAEAKEMAARDEALLREEVRNRDRWEAEDARMDCN